MDELQSQFTSDAAEIIDKLAHDISDLREARQQGPQRRELAARIFRHVHTLKGSSRALEIHSVGHVAHEFEAVLDGVRLGRIELTDDVIDLFEDAADALANAVAAESLRKPIRTSQQLTTRLAALAAAGKNQPMDADDLRSTLPTDIARALSEYDLQHAREAIREGASLFIASARFPVDDFDEGFRELTATLGATGEVIATVPTHGSASGEVGFRLLYAAEIAPTDLQSAAILGQVEITPLTLRAEPPDASRGTRQPIFQFEAQRASSVQVSLRQIEELVSDLRELFRETSKTIGLAGTSNYPPDAVTLQRQFSTLEEKLIKLRLVPCAALLERAVIRSGRIAARELGKQVEFEIEGGDVGVDKSLADIVVDPLLHLVRNAIIHGIEDPDERLSAGKPAAGKIKLRARSKGSMVHLTISDDGRGIDIPRIAEVAREQGIVKPGERLPPDQCLRLIFRPGFSTARTASEMSGRGIGLEIVDRAMEHAGGEVRLATEAGKGTNFVMMLPSALAVMPCVIVSVGDQFYGIPGRTVDGMRSLNAGDLATLKTRKTVSWDGKNIQAVSLRKLVDHNADDEPANASALLWRADDEEGCERVRHYALLVDSIVGQHETLIRGLGRHAARWPGVSGAAELWDGRIALVLDVGELLTDA